MRYCLVAVAIGWEAYLRPLRGSRRFSGSPRRGVRRLFSAYRNRAIPCRIYSHQSALVLRNVECASGKLAVDDCRSHALVASEAAKEIFGSCSWENETFQERALNHFSQSVSRKKSSLLRSQNFRSIAPRPRALPGSRPLRARRCPLAAASELYWRGRWLPSHSLVLEREFCSPIGRRRGRTTNGARRCRWFPGAGGRGGRQVCAVEARPCPLQPPRSKSTATSSPIRGGGSEKVATNLILGWPSFSEGRPRGTVN
jgi:hypothetical protein